MRIISKYQDYYDGIQSWGQNKENVYVRNVESLPIDIQEFGWGEHLVVNIYADNKSVPLKHIPKNSRKWYDAFGFTFETGYIGFCGTIYPFITATSIETKLLSNGTREVASGTFFDIELLECFIEKHNKKSNFREELINGLAWYGTYFKSFSKWFSRKEKNDELFHFLKCPIFLLQQPEFKKEWTIEKNIQLKSYEFHRVFDTYAAFQEIEMYYFGVLGATEKDTIDIDDKYLQQAKGFDHKYSFKTEPTKKRK